MAEIYQIYQILSIASFVLAGGGLVIIILSFWRWKMSAVIREWIMYRKRQRLYKVKPDNKMYEKKQKKEVFLEGQETMKLEKKQQERKAERKKKTQMPEKLDLLQDIILVHTEELIM